MPFQKKFKSEFWFLGRMELKTNLKKAWRFFWHSDSIWSWLLNILVAFVIIKFVVYPLVGLLLGTNYPLVAVVSESMEHSLSSQQLCGQTFTEFKDSFGNYWEACGKWYEEKGISQEEFRRFPFKNGFYKGDLILAVGSKPKNLQVGDVLIFQGGKPQPIIHRIVKKSQQADGSYLFQTKGDHNSDSLTGFLGETEINEKRIVGKGLIRVPYFGWVKIVFVQLMSYIGITIIR